MVWEWESAFALFHISLLYERSTTLLAVAKGMALHGSLRIDAKSVEPPASSPLASVSLEPL